MQNRRFWRCALAPCQFRLTFDSPSPTRADRAALLLKGCGRIVSATAKPWTVLHYFRAETQMRAAQPSEAELSPPRAGKANVYVIKTPDGPLPLQRRYFFKTALQRRRILASRRE